MPLCHFHWFSNVLQKHVETNVILPSAGKPPFATYYLLHGLSDDYSGWLRRTRIEWHVRELPLIVVMPDGYRGFYTDNAEGPAYGTYIAEELVDCVERNFPAKRSRVGRCIGGLSMGGYGALRLALSNPHRYASANSHSGALLYGARNGPRDPSPLTPLEQRQIFGPEPVGTSHDLLAVAARAKESGGKLPKLQLDCGTEDHLIEYSRAVHQELLRLGIPHEYREHAGAHDWDYWERRVLDAITFHARVLRLTPSASAAAPEVQE
jgi:S-formylglutathione hydrolase FrmB